MAILHGESIIISVDGQAVAASKTCSISVEVELIEVAPQQDGQVREFVPGRLSWKASVGHLVSQFSDQLLLRVGQEVTLTMTFKGDEELSGRGQAIMTKCALSAAIGSLASGQFEFTGTGYLNNRLYDLFLGTVRSEFIRSVDGRKLRIRWS